MDPNDNQAQSNLNDQPQQQAQSYPLPHSHTHSSQKIKMSHGPVGTFNKETSPISESLIRPTEAHPRIHSEVREVGVETVSEKPEIKEEHKKAGIEHAKEETPVKTEPSASVVIPDAPMTQQKAQQILKQNRNSASSLLWMAMAVIRQIKKKGIRFRKSEL